MCVHMCVRVRVCVCVCVSEYISGCTYTEFYPVILIASEFIGLIFPTSGSEPLRIILLAFESTDAVSRT